MHNIRKPRELIPWHATVNFPKRSFAQSILISHQTCLSCLNSVFSQSSRSSVARSREIFPYKHWPQHLANPAKLLQQCSAQDHAGCTQIIRSSFTLNVYKEGISTSRNRFIWVCIQAYNSQHNPIIRPDDVWLAILT